MLGNLQRERGAGSPQFLPRWLCSSACVCQGLPGFRGLPERLERAFGCSRLTLDHGARQGRSEERGEGGARDEASETVSLVHFSFSEAPPKAAKEGDEASKGEPKAGLAPQTKEAPRQHQPTSEHDEQSDEATRVPRNGRWSSH